MTTELLFEYSCPECGRGAVKTTRVHNYKTKIKGYPFVVDEALIGVCDQCQAESFAPEETRRWEELFSRSLEAHHAFLLPEEIGELRKSLGLSMEDFARLIGSTRQSISMWEKTNRTAPPIRTADLLMKLVRQSLQSGPVDVPTFLLDEARKWGVVIELRRPATRSNTSSNVILFPKKRPANGASQKFVPSALAARTSEEKEQFVAETTEGKPVGVLNFSFKEGALILDLTESLLSWNTVDVELETRSGQHFRQEAVSLQDHRLVLLKETQLREADVSRIILKPHGVDG